MSRITHILLDFFGTLVDYSAVATERRHAECYTLLQSVGYTREYLDFVSQWDAAFEEFHRRAQLDWCEYSLDEVCHYFLTQACAQAPRLELVQRFRDAYVQEWNQGIRYVAGIEALLRDLSDRFALALVTNTCYAPLVYEHLRALGIEHFFSAIVTSIEHGKKKPSPCIFRRALDLSHGTVETAVHVGDSFDADYQGARAAGIDCLLIDPQHRYPVPADRRIESVTDLRARLLEPTAAAPD